MILARSHKRLRYRRLNLRFLLIVLLLSGTAAIAIYFLHQHQLRQISGAFLQRAESLENEGEWLEAARYLDRYLTLNPNRADIRVRLAHTFDRGAASLGQKRRACELYYRAIGYAPDDLALRGRLAERLLQLEQFLPAAQQADFILSRDPDHLVALRVRAATLYAQATAQPGSLQAARRVLEQILADHPADQDSAILLAALYRERLTEPDERQRRQLADAAIDRLVEHSGHATSALLVRYHYRRQYGIAGAADDLQRALQQGQDQPEVLVAAVEAALDDGEAQKAVQLCEELISLVPHVPEMYLLAARSYWALSEPKTAIENCHRGLLIEKEHPALNLLLAELLINEQRLEQAHQVLGMLREMSTQSAIAKTSANQQTVLQPSINLLLAKWHMAADQPWQAIIFLKHAAVGAQAAATSQQARQLEFEALQMLGAIYDEQQQWDLAAAAYERAAKLPPAKLETYLQAARLWMASGRLEDAAKWCQEALRQDRSSSDAWLLLGQVRLQQCQQEGTDQWISALERTLSEAEPVLAGAWQLQWLKAQLCLCRQQQDEALRIFQQLEEQHRDVVELWQQLAVQYERLAYQQDADRALEHLQQLTEGSVETAILRASLLVLRGQLEEARQQIARTKAAADPRELGSLLQLAADVERHSGDLEKARQQYASLARQSASLHVLQQLVEVAFLRHDLEDAEHWENELRQLEGEAGSWWRLYQARRLLLQAESQQDSHFARALELKLDLEARRPSWAPARILSGMVAEHEGRVEEAITAYEQAVRLGSAETSLYERLIMLLYKQEDYARAARYLKHFRQLHGPNYITPAVVVPLVDHLVEEGRQQEAEPWLQQAARQPMGDMALLQLAAAGRAEQAVELCLQKLSEQPSAETGLTLARILLEMPDRQMAPLNDQVTPWLNRLADDYAADPTLLLALGNVRLKQQQVDAALALLERVTQLDPSNVLAWNNLAAVIAEQPGGEQLAEAYADRAIQLAGKDVPLVLLDTKATVLLYQGKTSQAIQMLRDIVAQPEGEDPRYFLHLAMGYAQLETFEEANAALAKAQSLGIDEIYLTPLEQTALAELRRQLDSEAPAGNAG